MTVEEIRYRSVDTPALSVLFAFTPKGLCFVTLTGELSQLEDWRERHEPKAELIHDRRLEPDFTRALRAAAEGRVADLSVRLDLRGTDFQKKVWRELRRIPRGATRTYADIARRIGNPKACRAVGRANGSNPVPLAIPCHRVVGAQGLGGFTYGGQIGGLEVKRGLLEAEGALLPT
jgi:O-6-methylguanine DNA methyltransferase